MMEILAQMISAMRRLEIVSTNTIQASVRTGLTAPAMMFALRACVKPEQWTVMMAMNAPPTYVMKMDARSSLKEAFHAPMASHAQNWIFATTMEYARVPP